MPQYSADPSLGSKLNLLFNKALLPSLQNKAKRGSTWTLGSYHGCALAEGMSSYPMAADPSFTSKGGKNKNNEIQKHKQLQKGTNFTELNLRANKNMCEGIMVQEKQPLRLPRKWLEWRPNTAGMWSERGKTYYKTLTRGMLEGYTN